MPGVPSGRGCEACRKQKKKCDAAKPACSRCARLQIPCIGAGQQRYKFHNQTVTSSGSRAGSWSPASVPSPEGQAAQVAHVGVVSSLSQPPSNKDTMTMSQLVSALGVLDPRFDLSVYGNFMREIPRRLGTNEALDAAMDTMTTALPLVLSRQHSAEAYGKYAQALKALRVCISDPEKMASSNTMCALYMIVICQGWMGDIEDHQPSHGEAVAHMLNTIPWRTWTSPFEKDMLTTMVVLVVMESFVNPRIQLDPDLWSLPETFGPRSPADQHTWVNSLKNRNLARITTLVRNPEAHLLEIELTYHRIRADVAQMAAILADIPLVMAPNGQLTTPLPLISRRLHVRWQTGYGILLLVSIMLNKILRVYKDATTCDPDVLREQCAGFVDSIINLAIQASQYRPLGSSATPLFLYSAYAALEDGQDEKARQIESLLVEYQSDFHLSRRVGLAYGLREWLRSPEPGCSPTAIERRRAAYSAEQGDPERISSQKVELCTIL